MTQSFRKTSITPGQQKRQSSLANVPELNSLKMSASDLEDIDIDMDNNDSQMAPPKMRAPLSRKSTIVSRHVTENIGSIQQAINTCNIAAIVMALKSLGVTCSMDEIFSSLKLPTSWVVEQGLTLAQVYHVLTKLCGSSNPSESLASGLNTECYHFDEGVAEFSNFVAFLTESISDSENILIANFNTKIAKDVSNGGGHFSCIAGFKPSTQMVTIADVHPLKYGEKWTCTARKLFDSMVDRDGSVKRARGIIRLSLRSAPAMEHMKECKQSVTFYDPKYSDEVKDWLSRWGDLPAAAYESHLNMGGLSGLGLVLSGFLASEDFDALNLPGHVSADFLTWSLHLSVIDLLSGLVSPLTLMNYARRACEKLEIDLKITTEVADTTSPDDVYTWFDNRIGPSHSAAALVLLDINEAFGTNLRKTDVGSEAAVLDHGAQHWCCIVATSNNSEVIIADPCAAMMTRLWKCNTSRLRSALLRAKKDPGRVIILGNVPMENSMM